ncbi:MAG TPA: NAD(P)-dependent oxidoreductase [bacterium (Candidatus Stahlbacteria)]|nr:NAD(P)-dependent oxidoreductase [Candidatus Stahlbacteria bacterium]
MAKVFLTGGSGFVGSWIARYLSKAGYDLTVLVRESSSLAHISDLRFHKIIGDLTYPKSYFDHQGFDYIVHAGARVRSVRSYDYYRTNLEGTRYLMRFAGKEKVKGVLFISSLVAAGPPCLKRPVSHYGFSKYLAERVIKNSELPFTILRLPVVYGPGDREGVRLFNLLKNNILFLPGHDIKLRLIFIRDLARLVIDILRKDYFSRKVETVNDGRVYLLSDVLRIGAFLINRRPITVSVPWPILILTSTLCDGIVKNHRLVSRDKMREFRYPDWTSDSTPFISLDFRPEYDVEAGLRETLGVRSSHFT